ncbi:MAG: hypothetical protein HKN13_11285, partial [Rhodothermales bacterium]|nr:hypothetical protein [Rhodothermales bacterium]
ELSSNLEEPDRLGGRLTFSGDIQPIFDSKCTSCHAAAVRPMPAAGLSLDTWELLLMGSRHGEAIIPFDADRSLLVRLAADRSGPAHPGELGADTLSSDELQAIRSWIDQGARSDDGTVPFEGSRDLLYVCNQEDATVTIVDMDLNVVSRVVDLRDHGFSASAKPHHVAVEPDGSAWYVSLIGDNAVAKFDRDNSLVGQFSFETPGMLALDPNSEWLYVGRSLSAPNPPASVGRMDRTDMSGEEISVVFERPHALAVGPAGSYVYSASLGANQIISIRASDADVSFSPVGGALHAFVQHVVSPDGGTMASSAQLTSRIIFFDLSDPAQPQEIWSTGTNEGPWHPSFSVDGEFLLVGNKDANTVSFVSVDGRRVEDIVTGDGLAQPHGSFVSPDGRILYVSNRNAAGSYQPRHDFGDNLDVGTVAVIDIDAREIVKVLEVGRFAAGINGRAR